MADQSQVTVKEPDTIRKEMEETRASLDEKLEALEQKVTSTVDETRAAVTDTVATVRESVQSSMEAIQEALNLRQHVQDHPWAMVGGSVALGALMGWFSPSSSDSSGRWPARSATSSNGVTPGLQPPPPQKPALLGQVANALAPEMDQVKRLAIGTLGGVLRDLIVDHVSENLRPQLTDLANNWTEKLGGEPFRGRILAEPTEDKPAHGAAIVPS